MSGSNNRSSAPDVAAVVISLIALLFSLWTFSDQRRSPTVELLAPVVVRFAQQGETAWFFVQPSFANIGSTSRTEVISRINLRVIPNGSATGKEFLWAGLVTFPAGQEGPTSDNIEWNWAGDPAPLAVTATDPKSPVCYFVAPGWAWTPGQYNVEITATRSTTTDPLHTLTFKIDLPPDKVKQVISSGLAAAVRTS